MEDYAFESIMIKFLTFNDLKNVYLVNKESSVRYADIMKKTRTFRERVDPNLISKFNLVCKCTALNVFIIYLEKSLKSNISHLTTLVRLECLHS